MAVLEPRSNATTWAESDSAKGLSQSNASLRLGERKHLASISAYPNETADFSIRGSSNESLQFPNLENSTDSSCNDPKFGLSGPRKHSRRPLKQLIGANRSRSRSTSESKRVSSLKSGYQFLDAEDSTNLLQCTDNQIGLNPLQNKKSSKNTWGFPTFRRNTSQTDSEMDVESVKDSLQFPILLDSEVSVRSWPSHQNSLPMSLSRQFTTRNHGVCKSLVTKHWEDCTQPSTVEDNQISIPTIQSLEVNKLSLATGQNDSRGGNTSVASGKNKLSFRKLSCLNRKSITDDDSLGSISTKGRQMWEKSKNESDDASIGSVSTKGSWPWRREKKNLENSSVGSGSTKNSRKLLNRMTKGFKRKKKSSSLSSRIVVITQTQPEMSLPPKAPPRNLEANGSTFMNVYDQFLNTCNEVFCNAPNRCRSNSDEGTWIGKYICID